MSPETGVHWKQEAELPFLRSEERTGALEAGESESAACRPQKAIGEQSISRQHVPKRHKVSSVTWIFMENRVGVLGHM